MGSWTQGVLASVGLATDLATNIGSLVINAQNADTNRKLAAAQMDAIQRNLELQKRAQDIELTLANPTWRYNKAIEAGYDMTSAMQFAGRTAPRISGGVHLGPVKQLEVDGMARHRLANAGLAAGQLFSHGAPGPRRQIQAGRPVYFHPDNLQDRVQNWVNRLPASSSGTWSSNSTQSTSLSSVFGVHPPRGVTIGHGGAHSVWSSTSV
uniref:Minor structural protein n=1 Tax=Mops bat calicivirus TaxID=3141891 RepID=A0AAU7E3N8_9CALI